MTETVNNDQREIPIRSYFDTRDLKVDNEKACTMLLGREFHTGTIRKEKRLPK